MTKVIGLIGMPGSGKTTACELLKERNDYNFKGFQMKEIASEQFMLAKDQGLNAFPESMKNEIENNNMEDQVIPEGKLEKEVADWVDRVLNINSSFFAEKASEEIGNIDRADVVVVDGIRSVPDAECIMNYSDESYLIYLHTPFFTRLTRLKQRGLDSEILVKLDDPFWYQYHEDAADPK